MKQRITLAEYNPEIAAQWHPTKNSPLTPEMVASKSSKKVWWLGECGHEWQATILNRVVQNSNCPYCSGQRVLTGFNDLATVNPQLAADWHPSKNGKLTPKQITSKSGKKVWWQCDNGHEWEAKIENRTNGSRCPFCLGLKAIAGQTDLASVHPEVAAQWHPTKNENLTPTQVTTYSRKKVWWLCPNCGHEWQADINNRSKGAGCPICARKRPTKRNPSKP